MLEIDDIDFPQISEMLNDVSDRYSLRSRDQVLVGCSQTLPCQLLPPLYLQFLFFLSSSSSFFSSSFRCSSSFFRFLLFVHCPLVLMVTTIDTISHVVTHSLTRVRERMRARVCTCVRACVRGVTEHFF